MEGLIGHGNDEFPCGIDGRWGLVTDAILPLPML